MFCFTIAKVLILLKSRKRFQRFFCKIAFLISVNRKPHWKQAARNDKEITRKERGKSKERASNLVDFEPKLVENHAEIHPPQGTIRNL